MKIILSIHYDNPLLLILVVSYIIFFNRDKPIIYAHPTENNNNNTPLTAAADNISSNFKEGPFNFAKQFEYTIWKVLKTVLKRQILFLPNLWYYYRFDYDYYYGFLFTIIVNSAIWMFISFIVNKYYWKSTGFKDEKYLMHYVVSKLNSRSRRA
jgi:hypothetical protein